MRWLVIGVCAAVAVVACVDVRDPAQPRTDRIHPLVTNCEDSTAEDYITMSPCDDTYIVSPNLVHYSYPGFTVFNDLNGNGNLSVTCTGAVSSCSLSETTDFNDVVDVYYNTGASGSGTIELQDKDTIDDLHAKTTLTIKIGS